MIRFLARTDPRTSDRRSSRELSRNASSRFWIERGLRDTDVQVASRSAMAVARSRIREISVSKSNQLVARSAPTESIDRSEERFRRAWRIPFLPRPRLDLHVLRSGNDFWGMACQPTALGGSLRPSQPKFLLLSLDPSRGGESGTEWGGDRWGIKKKGSLCLCLCLSVSASVTTEGLGRGSQLPSIGIDILPLSMRNGSQPLSKRNAFRTRMLASRDVHQGTKRERYSPTGRGKLSVRPGRYRASCVRVVAAVKAGAENGVVFHQTLVARSGEEDSVRDVCQKRSEASRNAIGANKKSLPVDVRLEQDASDPNVFFIWERYRSQLAMVQHQTETEYVQWLEEVRPFLEEPVRMVLYEYKDGMLGVPSVYLGPKGEGGLDDATGAAGTNAGASYNQQMQIDLGNIRRGDEGDSFGMDSSR